MYLKIFYIQSSTENISFLILLSLVYKLPYSDLWLQFNFPLPRDVHVYMQTNFSTFSFLQ